MKKILLLGAIALLSSCNSRDEDNNIATDTTIINHGMGIGSVEFTFKGKKYSYTNHNYKDGGIDTNIFDITKPSLMWGKGHLQNQIYFAFDSGKLNNNPYDENYLYISFSEEEGVLTSMVVRKGNGTGIEGTTCTHPKLIYTTDTLDRMSGSFTSDQCSGTFKNIVKGN